MAGSSPLLTSPQRPARTLAGSIDSAHSRSPEQNGGSVARSSHGGPQLTGQRCDGGQQLLKGMAQAPRLTVCARTVNDMGQTQTFSYINLADLCSQLWPEGKSPERLRALRFLSDDSKVDFLLRPLGFAYLLRTDFVRALAEPTRVIFLQIAGVNPTFERFWSEFVEMARPDESPFDLWSVESIVCATVTMHTMRLDVMRPVIHKFLRLVELRASDSLILKLYPLKVAISKFIEQVRPLVTCLRGLLHTEAEALRVTEDTAVGTKGFEEIVETWAVAAQEMMADAMGMSQNIDDATHFSDASLSYLRTRLLRMELTADVMSLAMTFAAMVAGIFGMNLKSGLEEEDNIFMKVVIATAVVCIIIVLATRAFYARGKGHYRGKCTRYSNNKFFHEIQDDAYVRRVMAMGEEHREKRILQDLEVHLQPGWAAGEPQQVDLCPV